MEVNIWGCLWNLDSGPFLMRQRVPDVCVFRRCHFEAWYYSNSSGLLLRRRDDVTLDALLEAFGAAASDGSQRSDEQTPAAILRRQSTRLEDGSAPLDVPHATVLSLGQLRDLVEQVRGGEAEDEVWSLQTIVQPEDGLRVVSTYSCDSAGKEKSEVFARHYHRCYALPTQSLTLPLPEAVAADGCVEVPPSRRAAVETKTLSAVRFASRFHGLDFEGLVLEFVFDASGNAVLHGCWCATAFPPEARRRLRGRPSSGQRPCSAPRSFPVPTVEAREGAATPRPPEREGAPPPARAASPLGRPGGAPAHAASPLGRAASPGPAPGSAAPPSKAECGAEGCCVTLEVWRAECFLGEALLPRQRPGAPSQEHTLELCVGEPSWPSRLDSRKRRRFVEAPSSAGSVTLRAEWVQGDEQAPLLQLALLRAEGLPPAPPDAAHAGPRVQLWQRRWGSSDFLPLWTSSEAREHEPLIFDPPRREEDGPGPVVWDEPVNLSLGPVHVHLHGDESNQDASHMYSHSGPRGGPPKSTPEPALAYQPCPIELETSLKSKDEHVLGAEAFTHWGMSEANGSLLTHILSAQVSNRMSTECRGRETRSSLLTKMAMQLEQFHDLQSEWEEEVIAAKASFRRVGDELDFRAKEAVLIKDETSGLVQEHERRLASVCSELYDTVDEHRIQRECDEEAIEASRARTAQKRTMVKHLREKNRNLEESLQRTVRKFDEVSTSYASLQRELARRQTARQPSVPPPQHPDILTARTRAHALVLEAAQEERDLVDLKTRLNRLREDLQVERAHSGKLEDFVRSVASAPATRMRTGGGFDVDFAARREAALLMQEIAQG